MIGTTLDKYEVLQKVGEGGMATVYRGRHNTLDRDVAIKVLHPHLSSSTRNRKRFAREARAIEHLRHDNILEIFDYSGVEANDCYIITEFVQGETLTSLLHARGRLPSEVVAIIGFRLVRALAYAHHEGILHRDLKPDNVMVRVDGTVKLMDFGIARFLDESQVTMTGALVGSPAFMSPEQAKEETLDHRSDLFSLGTTLYYLVTGRLPFSGSNPSLILKNVIEANRPSVSEVAPEMSPGLADVIERLMATNPDDRYKDADDVANALAAVLAESNVDADEDRWSLRTYLHTAETYEDALQIHLIQVLILRGKERLGTGDHLAALRLFNRLLAIDEDNEEVLELVQSLHGSTDVRAGGRALLVGALIIAVLGGSAYAYVWYERTARAQPPMTPAPTISALPSPSPQPSAVLAPPAAPEPEPVAVAPDPETPAPSPAPRRIVERPQPMVAPIVEEPEQEWGHVRVEVTSELYGNIYVDDTYMAKTLDGASIPVSPGAHVFEVRGPRIQTWRQTVEVSPGEQQIIQVELLSRPSDLSFLENQWPGACVVTLDGNLMGTIDKLGRVLEVKRPNQAHTISATCPDERTLTKDYDIVLPGKSFPPPVTP